MEEANMNTTNLLSMLRILIFTIALGVLFIVFLIKSIKRGRRIEELEKQLKELQKIADQGMQPQIPMAQPMYGQPSYPPYQAPVQDVNTQTQGFYQNGQPVAGVPVQTEAFQQTPVFQPAPPPVVTAQPYAAPGFEAPAPVTNNIPDQTPTPSWATPPSKVQRPQTVVAETPAPAPRQKFFSSINITFGIGVLLLTIVGATFMTGSWDWMTEEIRAISLVILVVLVYGMSFLAGKVLKLQQTGFALYSLASLLGPIVIVGMGSFELLGPGFSFKSGSGWLVATVASLLLLVSAVGGRFIFRDEKTQANIYQGTTYISLTWLVVFLSAQIGQGSEVVNEWSMILLGLSTLALAFRIIDMTKIFEGEKFFKVYSEIVLYIPAVLLVFSVALGDGALFGAMLINLISLVLFAKFRKGRQWVKYITPLFGVLTAVNWCVFENGEEMYVMTSVTMVILFVVYVVHKVFGISTGVSEIGLPVSLCLITTFVSFEDIPEMGAAACFITVAIFVFQLVFEPVLAKNSSVPEGIFKGAVSMPSKIALSIVSALFYYLGTIMIFLTIKMLPYEGHLYLPLTALVPVIIALIVRFVWKDDIRITMAGAVLAVISSIVSLISCSTIEAQHRDILYKSDICSWVFVISIMVMALFFMVSAIKEKRFSFVASLWASVFLNAVSAGVFLFIGHQEDLVFTYKPVPGNSFEIARQIASVSFLALNVIALAVSFFFIRKKEGVIKQYASVFKYISCVVSLHWFLLAWLLIGSNWKLVIVAAVFAALLSVFDMQMFSILPIIASEISIISELEKIDSNDLRNVILIAVTVAVAGLGRLIFRKKIFSKKAIDYLSFTAVMFLFPLQPEDYVAMMVFLTLALLVINLAGRVKITSRVLLSVFAALVCMAIVTQPFFDYPELIKLEIDMLLMLGTLFLICRVIKPAPAKVMKYFWFTGVALCIVAEGVSAAVTGEAFDLILVGTASFGIFIFAFIRRNRLWFILGIISMISIAVYLSLAFWSSLVWLIYLLVAGVILVVMAALNEWGKRHNKEGKNKRFFQEWTW